MTDTKEEAENCRCYGCTCYLQGYAEALKQVMGIIDKNMKKCLYRKKCPICDNLKELKAELEKIK